MSASFRPLSDLDAPTPTLTTPRMPSDLPAQPIPGWPDLEALSKISARPWVAALSLLPVVLTADGCHLNVMPLSSMMRPFTKQGMDKVAAVSLVRGNPDLRRGILHAKPQPIREPHPADPSSSSNSRRLTSRRLARLAFRPLTPPHAALSLPPSLLSTPQAIATVFYIAFCASAYWVFGEGLQEDILSNLKPETMAPLIGRHQVGRAADVASWHTLSSSRENS